MQMRREGQSIRKSRKTTGYTFYFQITNNGGRRACSVRIAAPNLGDATTFFRQNWPVIESLARDGLAKSSIRLGKGNRACPPCCPLHACVVISW